MTAPRIRFCEGCPTQLTKYRKRWCESCGPIKDREAQLRSTIRIRQEFWEYKLSLGCNRCGYNKCPAALDFHHIDPELKERRVPIGYYTELGQKELAKCELLCKNCHYEEHFNEARGKGTDDRPVA